MNCYLIPQKKHQNVPVQDSSYENNVEYAQMQSGIY